MPDKIKSPYMRIKNYTLYLGGQDFSISALNKPKQLYYATLHHTSPQLTSTHLNSLHLTSPQLASPHFTSPHLTSPRLTSPRHCIYACMIQRVSKQKASTQARQASTVGREHLIYETYKQAKSQQSKHGKHPQ